MGLGKIYPVSIFARKNRAPVSFSDKFYGRFPPIESQILIPKYKQKIKVDSFAERSGKTLAAEMEGELMAANFPLFSLLPIN